MRAVVLRDGRLQVRDTPDPATRHGLDPLPSVGKVIGLDEVLDALELARRSDGPPRIVVHPNGDVA